MKGILLAAGKGTRLYPTTRVINKHFLLIYDKPLIYYSLSTLILAGIKDILIICNPSDVPLFKDLLDNGSNFGVNLSYEVQRKPKGIAEAFIIGEHFIGKDGVCLALGDNIFHGAGLSNLLRKATDLKQGALGFAYEVEDPQRYGVVEFDDEFNPISIEEKPENPKSNWAITGLYFYDNEVVKITKNLKPSKRGELEITDINKAYLREGKLRIIPLNNKGFRWFDCGTPDSLLEVSQFIKTTKTHKEKIALG